MKRTASFLLCGIAPLLLLVAAGASADPAPEGVIIQDVLYNGTGCPPGSIQVEVSPDGTSLRLVFSEDFKAEFGPGVPLGASRKSCQITLSLSFPAGFSFAVSSADYRGSVGLPAGARGMFKTTYYFTGNIPQASSWRTFVGPADFDWQIRDEVEVAALMWSTCGDPRPLNINLQVRAERGSAPSSSSGFMSMGSAQGFGLRWRACPDPTPAG